MGTPASLAAMASFWKGFLMPVFVILGGYAGLVIYRQGNGGVFTGGEAARAILIGAVAMTWIYIAFFGRSSARITIDPESGEREFHQDSPSFLFVPVMAWAILITIIAAAGFLLFDREGESESSPGPESSSLEK